MMKKNFFNNALRRAALMIDPLTGLPRTTTNAPISEDVTDGRFVFETRITDYAKTLKQDGVKITFDVDKTEEDE